MRKLLGKTFGCSQKESRGGLNIILKKVAKACSEARKRVFGKREGEDDCGERK